MSVDLNLPSFGLDCRDWLVATEADGLLVDESEGAAVLAILSTAIFRGAELASAQAVLSLALIDEASLTGTSGSTGEDGGDGEYAESVPFTGHLENWAGQDICVLDADWSAGYARFAVPAPGGELAVVAEFTSAPDPGRELIDRFYDLVTSFRWAA
jgi:hypothetical protein